MLEQVYTQDRQSVSPTGRTGVKQHFIAPTCGNHDSSLILAKVPGVNFLSLPPSTSLNVVAVIPLHEVMHFVFFYEL